MLFNNSDQVIAISKGLNDQLIDEFGIKKEKLSVIYNPVYDTRVQSGSREPVNHSPFDQSSDIVLSVGRLVPAKGYDILLRSFKKIIDQREANLVILGEGPERERLEQLSIDLGIKSCVYFPGFKQNPYKYMSNADVFVSSSRSEGFGNAIVEALGCETSVVATRCPSGPAEILADGRYGRLVPPENPHELARAIIESINCPTDRELLRSRAEDFSQEKIIDEYEQLLLSLT
ncbi:hypothetical protein DJ73_19415 [Halorubrum sp. Ea1]|nr:hypothetical protein DJ73_19415 [Halorubrum sp. Ea1]